MKIYLIYNKPLKIKNNLFNYVSIIKLMIYKHAQLFLLQQ
jgi:hypothetical protein